MAKVPPQLQEAAEQVHKDGKPRRVLVRDLLSWFEAERRGILVVREIRLALRRAKVLTVPDFEVAYIDQKIQLRSLSNGARTPRLSKASTVDESSSEVDSVMISGDPGDPAPRIGMLKAANTWRPPVTRDADVREAITQMHLKGYSHLPVMQGDRNPEGIISWRSIGMAKISDARPCKLVRECMEAPPQVVDWDMHLFEAIKIITEKEVVLVKNNENRITGLVTTTDISLHFSALSEPFLLLREIESYLRRMIAGKFSVEQLSAAHDQAYPPRKIESVAHLTFGEYIRLLENANNWKRLRYDLSRTQFIKQLRDAGRIRNDVMHFHPDGISEEDMELLRDTRKFLQALK